MRSLLVVLALAGVSACGASGGRVGGPEFATLANVTPNSGMIENYRIGPSDKLSLRVFQVEDLSFEEIYVDAAGNLQLPLLGSVQAAGLTPAELSRDLERRLGERYLRNPQIVVTVAAAASQKITVDGAVRKPGVYEMRGQTTLIQAVAMAEGATNVASLNSVAVFRTVDNRRMVAVFDLAAIRAGTSADPVLHGDDVIVVDTSRLSSAVRDVIQALPGLAVFGYI
jgi:polysaccharide biosynthesis/export protein